MDKRLVGISACALSAFLFLSLSLADDMGMRINLTDSAPHGIWYSRQLERNEPVVRGELVEVCPPNSSLIQFLEEHDYIERGDCAKTHAIPFLKPVGAVAGDVVLIQPGQDVMVNGTILPNTAPQPNIPAWSNGTYLVAPGSVWLFSSYSTGSLDSRYFGPVSTSLIRAHVRPVLVSGNVNSLTPWSTR